MSRPNPEFTDAPQVHGKGMQIMFCKLADLAKRFRNNTNGGAAMQFSLIFGGIGIAMAVLLAPQLRDVSEQYAMEKSIAVDNVVTGSIEKSDTPKRYTIRKSVLDLPAR